MEILVSIAFAASGLALLCYGGNWLVDGGIAMRFQISRHTGQIGHMTPEYHGDSMMVLFLQVVD